MYTFGQAIDTMYNEQPSAACLTAFGCLRTGIKYLIRYLFAILSCLYAKISLFAKNAYVEKFLIQSNILCVKNYFKSFWNHYETFYRKKNWKNNFEFLSLQIYFLTVRTFPFISILADFDKTYHSWLYSHTKLPKIELFSS